MSVGECLALVAVVTVGSACLPLPGTHPVAPALVGLLKDGDGRPRPDVELLVAAGYGGGACRSPLGRAVTDSGGVFRFPQLRKQNFVILIPGWDLPMPSYAVCAVLSDTAQLVYWSDNIAWPDSLSCTHLTSPQPAVACRRRNDTR